MQPKWSLDIVVGHEAAKERLREDAELLKRGELESLPMGYLFCGAVGTGKTFLAQCTAGEIGIPCVILKNVRSKYVGETEGNLEKVVSGLRAMGPGMGSVDEADAALGDRDSSGDSGTSSRVFGMIATQMGDTRYRGKILWMLITARPDLLPIDIKRQGRAEVHIPLFYPADEEEVKDLFVVLAKKFGTSIKREDIPPIPQKGSLSGADIEGMVGRARRRSLLQGADVVLPEALATVIDQFMPSTEGLEKELQETAAIIECTDRQFLPESVLKRLAKAGGRARLQERLNELEIGTTHLFVPAICADASDPSILADAGLNNRYCKGLIALTNNDETNLKIAITGKLLNTSLPVISRSDNHDTGLNIASFGTEYIINFYESFANRLAIALQSPGIYLLHHWLTGSL